MLSSPLSRDARWLIALPVVLLACSGGGGVAGTSGSGGGETTSSTGGQGGATTSTGGSGGQGGATNNGLGNTSAPRTRPYEWVLVTPELRAREAPVVIGAAHFDTGLVVDTRVYTPIADLAPALAGDSGATGMQHMAVVRDFLLE